MNPSRWKHAPNIDLMEKIRFHPYLHIYAMVFKTPMSSAKNTFLRKVVQKQLHLQAAHCTVQAMMPSSQHPSTRPGAVTIQLIYSGREKDKISTL